MANGLTYLHSKNIIHGDLKAVRDRLEYSRRLKLQCYILQDNILVSKDGTGAQLAYFGISRALMSEDFANLKTSSNNVQGTLRWMAIEQFSDTTPGAREQYSFATDIWSFGMTIYVRPARFCKPPPLPG